MEEQKKDVINLAEVFQHLKMKKKVFFIVLPIVFVLSGIYTQAYSVVDERERHNGQ
jgi:asparagine N-glycosylation enzyme membrane subunit Stt3